MEIIILENQNFNSQQELFSKISELLVKQKKVRESFYAALIKREKDFPTGLQGKKRNIAIPHVDCEHVLDPGYFVVINNQLLNFNSMSNINQKLKVNLIIFILSNNLKGHMPLLTKTLNLANTNEINTKIELLNYFKNEKYD